MNSLHSFRLHKGSKFRRDRVTLIEVEKEQERLEKARLDDEKRKEERKQQSVKVCSSIILLSFLPLLVALDARRDHTA